MDLGQNDLKHLFKIYEKLKLDEQHMVIIIYNLLCALNFIHSLGVAEGWLIEI